LGSVLLVKEPKIWPFGYTIPNNNFLRGCNFVNIRASLKFDTVSDVDS